jgi:transposase
MLSTPTLTRVYTNMGISPELLLTILGLPNIEIESVSLNSAGELEIRVKSITEGAVCYNCGRRINKPYYPGKEVRLRHLPVCGYPTYILIAPLRYQCEHCDGNPTTTQKLDWYELRHSGTNAYEDHILLSLINSTIRDVSIREGIGYDVIEGILDRNIRTAADWEKIEKLDIIGIDEISNRKGHKDFLAIVTAYIDGKLRVIAVLKDREKATVKEFFMSIPKRLRKTVKAVCSDLYKGYINAAKEVFGKKVPIVADRFHVAKLYRKGLDGLRKKEMKRLKEELSEKDYEKLKNAMWILRKPIVEMTEEELKTMKLIFKHSPRLKEAYDLCFDLTKIFDSDINPSQAKRKIKGWMRRVKNSGLTCFDAFLKTLSNWMEEITNYFIDQNNSGFVEGLNNKIKVIKRRCYGLTNIKRLFQRLWLGLKRYSLLLLISCVFFSIAPCRLLDQLLDLRRQLRFFLFQAFVAHRLVFGAVRFEFRAVETDMPQPGELHLDRQLHRLFETIMKKLRIVFPEIA